MVLLVDDENNILQSLKRLLRYEPYLVSFADSGDYGLKLLESMQHASAHVAVIISDQKMPGMDGVQFLQHSRELAPHASRMLMTGFSNNTVTIGAINNGGITRYISKPWNDDDLLCIIRNAVLKFCQKFIQNNQKYQHVRNEYFLQPVTPGTAEILKHLEELQFRSRRQQNDIQGVVEALSALVDPRTQNPMLSAVSPLKLETGTSHQTERIFGMKRAAPAKNMSLDLLV